jgi:hypothetical protein
MVSASSHITHTMACTSTYQGWLQDTKEIKQAVADAGSSNTQMMEGRSDTSGT